VSRARGGRWRCRPRDGAGHHVVGSGIAWGAQCHGLGEDDIVVGSGMVSRAWGQGLHCQRHHWLGSEKMAARKGLDCGQK
jgi:hypothetical protein